MGIDLATKQAKLRMLRRKHRHEPEESTLPASLLRSEHAQILDLQHMVGNQAVQRMLAARTGSLQREPRTRTRRINYTKAERANKHYAEPDKLGWADKLATIADGAYAPWGELWANGDYEAFADAVAEYQASHDLSPDGILGLGTWSKIGGLGEAMAGQDSVRGEKAQKVCTIASEERIKRGHKLATGKAIDLPDDKSASVYNIILQTIESRMDDIGEEYRATGAAGALVYAGLGEFLTEDEMWTGALKPGAALQVWASRTDFDLLRAADEDRYKQSEMGFWGTSMVFVRYASDDHQSIVVRHFGRTEVKSRSDFEVWVAANVK